MISRRQFLQFAAAAAPLVVDGALARPGRSAEREGRAAAAIQRRGKPRGSEFVFARLRYESGDWDYNPKVAANVLNSIIEYTSIPVYQEEVVISASSGSSPCSMRASRNASAVSSVRCSVSPKLLV